MYSLGRAEMKRHGPWQIVKTKEVYRDPWFHVDRDNVVRPDGKPGTYTVVHLKPGVCVLALDEDQQVCLTEEFHYAVGRVTLEAVSGGIEPEEDPLQTAKRELQEELGITAEEWREMGTVDPFTASILSPVKMYLATKLSFGTQSLEGTETICLTMMSLREALRRVLESEITHSPTAVLILKTWLAVSQNAGLGSIQGSL
jgi:ADP-ribose pyrophosphatase